MHKGHTKAWLEPGARRQLTSCSLNTACGLTGENTPHTVDIRKRQLRLFYCLEWTALTVGEVEAGSHVAFRDNCPKAAHSEDGVDQEAQPSHAHCPHVSSGPPSNFAVFAFQVFGEFMKSFFCEAVLVFLRSLSAVPVSVLECRVFPLCGSWDAPRGLPDNTLVWNEDLETLSRTDSFQCSS